MDLNVFCNERQALAATFAPCSCAHVLQWWLILSLQETKQTAGGGSQCCKQPGSRILLRNFRHQYELNAWTTLTQLDCWSTDWERHVNCKACLFFSAIQGSYVSLCINLASHISLHLHGLCSAGSMTSLSLIIKIFNFASWVLLT